MNQPDQRHLEAKKRFSTLIEGVQTAIALAIIGGVFIALFVFALNAFKEHKPRFLMTEREADKRCDMAHQDALELRRTKRIMDQYPNDSAAYKFALEYAEKKAAIDAKVLQYCP